MTPKFKRKAFLAVVESDAPGLNQRHSRDSIDNPQLSFDANMPDGQRLYTARDAFEYRLQLDMMENEGLDLRETLRLVEWSRRFPLHPLNYPSSLPDLGIGMMVVKETCSEDDSHYSKLYVVGPLVDLQNLIFREFEAGKKRYQNEQDVVRVFFANVSRAAKQVRTNGADLSIPAFEEDHDLMYMLRDLYQWPVWVSQEMRDWSSIYMIDSR